MKVDDEWIQQASKLKQLNLEVAKQCLRTDVGTGEQPNGGRHDVSQLGSALSGFGKPVGQCFSAGRLHA
jgi:hypothetical protein